MLVHILAAAFLMKLPAYGWESSGREPKFLVPKYEFHKGGLIFMVVSFTYCFPILLSGIWHMVDIHLEFSE